jgi:hypothetical protein
MEHCYVLITLLFYFQPHWQTCHTTLPVVIITDNFIFSILFCFVHIFVYWLGGCGLDSTGSGQGPVAGCCECGDGPSGSCATELVN